ncbi:MAG: hypothetical protein IAB08_06955 [Bacteroidetes bacterium]|uniref:MotA/TolQ/ExbB proton channel domain-containing protein n=1 Tax=Candidatus Pullibacteroides excrementavium TaxID=2840905 RepID=A0A9D9DS91_9BACT|nr:hypothetical protein [Candidatus Pullibacteroides excrementavium]
MMDLAVDLQHSGHYVLIIAAVLVIIGFQWKVFRRNCFCIKRLQNVFPSKLEETLQKSVDESQTVSIQLSDSNPQISEDFCKILDTINGYLSNHHGVVNDFHLMKDIVDRKCDNMEEEISSLTPMPLYLGLIGTMFGILVGVGYLIVSKSIDSMLSIDADKASIGIKALLGGVALAMISSIVGILLTTVGALKSKNARVHHIETKNGFFDWLQIYLIPSLADNTTSAVLTLKQNLDIFNADFSNSIADLKSAFALMNQTFTQQESILERIEQIDLKKVAGANLKILSQLESTTSTLNVFNKSIADTTDYIERVRSLTSKLDDYLQRTDLIVEMGRFFKEENEQLKSRKTLLLGVVDGYKQEADVRTAEISQVIGKIDSTLGEAIRELQENTQQRLDEFNAYVGSQDSKMRDLADSFSVSQMMQELKKVTESIRQLQLDLKDGMVASQKSMQQFTHELAAALSKLAKQVHKPEVALVPKGAQHPQQSSMALPPSSPKAQQKTFLGKIWGRVRSIQGVFKNKESLEKPKTLSGKENDVADSK